MVSLYTHLLFNIKINLRWSETKNFRILIIDNFLSCHLMLMKLGTLIKHISKTEVEIFLTVIVSMVTVEKID